MLRENSEIVTPIRMLFIGLQVGIPMRGRDRYKATVTSKHDGASLVVCSRCVFMLYYSV